MFPRRGYKTERVEMKEIDHRMYMCSKCCRRFLWHQLSQPEHRCFHCRLPWKSCFICRRRFEPQQQTDLYCRHCDFNVKHAAKVDKEETVSLSSDTDLEPDEGEGEFVDVDEDEPLHKCSVTQRWRDIKAARQKNYRY